MQVLKNNQILIKNILKVLSVPFICLILNEMIKFIFQIGKYSGIFMRGLYELVLRNL